MLTMEPALDLDRYPTLAPWVVRKVKRTVTAVAKKLLGCREMRASFETWAEGHRLVGRISAPEIGKQ